MLYPIMENFENYITPGLPTADPSQSFTGKDDVAQAVASVLGWLNQLYLDARASEFPDQELAKHLLTVPESVQVQDYTPFCAAFQVQNEHHTTQTGLLALPQGSVFWLPQELLDIWHLTPLLGTPGARLRAFRDLVVHKGHSLPATWFIAI